MKYLRYLVICAVILSCSPEGNIVELIDVNENFTGQFSTLNLNIF